MGVESGLSVMKIQGPKLCATVLCSEHILAFSDNKKKAMFSFRFVDAFAANFLLN
jgi:hypothetical protein